MSESSAMGTASTTGTSRLAERDRELISEARRIGPHYRSSRDEADRLAGWLLKELADLAERLGGAR